jgi:DNA-binding transcriptional MerR regulator
MRARITIGDFSRASHLSIKTLRHYHDVGLLEPSHVDPGDGYRYYSEDQIAAAQVIRRLRGLQMPVTEVKSVLAAPDSEARNRLILGHLNRLEGDLASTAAAGAEPRALIARPQGARLRRTSDRAAAGNYRHPRDSRSRGLARLVAGSVRGAPHDPPRPGSGAGWRLREHYLAGVLDTEDPTSWETEIGWPIFRSDSEHHDLGIEPGRPPPASSLAARWIEVRSRQPPTSISRST